MDFLPLKEHMEKLKENPVNIMFNGTIGSQLSLRKNKASHVISKIRKKNNNRIAAKETLLQKVSLLELPPELKNADYIYSLINQETTDRIFDYINEIFKDGTYNENLLIYGLLLLTEKLCVSDTIDVKEIISHRFFEVVEKILIYCQGKYKNDQEEHCDKYIQSIFWLMANFSYFCNENEDDIFRHQNFIGYYEFFFNFVNNEYVMVDILLLLTNLSQNSFDNCLAIYSFNQGNLFKKIMDYIGDYLNKEKESEDESEIILETIKTGCRLLTVFINHLHFAIVKNNNFNLPINFEEIEEIYFLLVNITTIDDLAGRALCFINKILKIYLTIGKFDGVLLLFTKSKEMFDEIFKYDFSDKDCEKELIYSLRIFKKVFMMANKIDSEVNVVQMNDFIQDYINLVKYIKDDHCFLTHLGDLIFQITWPTPSLKMLSLLKVMLSGNIFNNLHGTAIINQVIYVLNTSVDYRVKKSCFEILSILVKKKFYYNISTIVGLDVFLSIKNNLFISLFEINNDPELIGYCLDIIELSLMCSQSTIEINFRNNFLNKFEEIGGRDLLEKIYLHPNQELSQRAQALLNSFFVQQ
ncbi:MAG: hypothetical protein MJ252_02185 [archaeon]|nr:hypothetical protein [archaeon]